MARQRRSGDFNSRTATTTTTNNEQTRRGNRAESNKLSWAASRALLLERAPFLFIGFERHDNRVYLADTQQQRGETGHLIERVSRGNTLLTSNATR